MIHDENYNIIVNEKKYHVIIKNVEDRIYQRDSFHNQFLHEPAPWITAHRISHLPAR